MNSDGTPDLLYGTEFGYVYYCRGIEPGDAAPFLTDEGRIQAAGADLDVGHRSCPWPTDWNGDGLVDLLVGCYTGEVWLYLNVGTPESYQYNSWTAVEIGGVPIDLYDSGPAMTDLTGDGLEDLLVCHWESPNSRILFSPNEGTAGAPEFNTSEYLYYNYGADLIEPYRYAYPHCGDYNSDGITDIIMGDYWGEVAVYLGSTVGTPETETAGVGLSVIIQGNPVTSALVLRTSSPTGISGGLYDVTGRCRQAIDIQAGQGMETVIDVSGLPTGVYTIVASSGEGSTIAGRFTVLR
jgi:hypothetical protein